MEKNYELLNAEPVLAKVEEYIAELEDKKARWGYAPRKRIWDVCNELSIFDWWRDELSLTQLKTMRSFLKEAIKLGYTGYVCFKVGATGCANGMWANTEPTTDGYSPKGCAFIYRSFTPDYVNWDAFDKDGNRLCNTFKEIVNVRDFEKALKAKGWR